MQLLCFCSNKFDPLAINSHKIVIFYVYGMDKFNVPWKCKIWESGVIPTQTITFILYNKTCYQIDVKTAGDFILVFMTYFIVIFYTFYKQYVHFNIIPII